MMDRFEDLLMKVARVFGIVVMGLTLLFAGIFVLVIVVRTTSSMFEQTHPKVKFYLGDFKTQDVQSGAIDIPGDDPDARYSAKILEEIVPAYQKVAEAYVDKKAEELGLKEAADKRKAIDDRVKGFRTSSDASLRQILAQTDIKEKKTYANGLVDYLSDAQSGGVDVYSDGGAPISNIYYSVAFQKFHQKFVAQLGSLRKTEDDSIGAILGRASTYFALVGCVLVFLLQAMMFAILRIEKKMKG